jgi:hypothetical protein
LNLLTYDSASKGDGALGGVSVLEHRIVLDNVFCPKCERDDSRFVIEYVFVNRFAQLNAFFGTCVRCGDERVAAFTRTVGEVA